MGKMPKFKQKKWWAFRVLLTVIFYAQKTHILQFSSSKISNSAHPVQKIQYLLNGKKWQSLPDMVINGNDFFAFFPCSFHSRRITNFLPKSLLSLPFFTILLLKRLFNSQTTCCKYITIFFFCQIKNNQFH